jgi:hypothetical protein
MIKSLSLLRQSQRPNKRPYSSAVEDDLQNNAPLLSAGLAASPVSERMSVEEASVLPPKMLRDELVLLYFRHIHLLCPFIDEYKFSEIYYMSETDDELLEHVDLCLFQAMMFAAFTVNLFHGVSIITILKLYTAHQRSKVAKKSIRLSSEWSASFDQQSQGTYKI